MKKTSPLICKAVIPAAGLGTRFLPATKAQRKETLPLFDRPMIQYVFDRSHELEQILHAKGDEGRLAELRRISELADIVYVRQPEQRGLGHAVLMAKDIIGNEPFAVFLPDDIIESRTPAIQQLLRVHERYGCVVLAAERIADSEVSRYGIIDGRSVGERTFKVERLIEKPKVHEAPSNLAVVGRYILTPEVFPILEKLKPGAMGEIQLTDALDALRRHQTLYAFEYEGRRHDGGTPLGLLKGLGRHRPGAARSRQRVSTLAPRSSQWSHGQRRFL